MASNIMEQNKNILLGGYNMPYITVDGGRYLAEHN